MSGSVQILFATLGWAPGDYLIAITHNDGWRHEVKLRKLEPGVAPPVPEPVAPALIFAGHFGGDMSELLLHIPLVDFGRGGEA